VIDVEAVRWVAVLVAAGSDPIPESTQAAIGTVLSELIVVRLDGKPGHDELELPRDASELASRIRGSSIMLIDGRCTGISAELISEALGQQAEHATIFVQPALETLKLVRSGRVVRTVDREQVRVVSTPCVVSGAVLGQVTDLDAALRDPALLVAELRRLGTIHLVEAPPHVRRASPAETSVG
jgi:hypothetical protein